MVITVPASLPGSGPRPVNLNRDMPQLIDLLQLVFGEKVDVDGQHLFSNSSARGTPPLLWRLVPTAVRLSPGFVWEVNGRLVGNVTLLPTKSPQRFLVANVAVHPDCRRRGIARRLMETALAEVRRRRGKTVLLQVVKDNTPAIDLYKSLHFQTLGSMTTWDSSVSRVRDLVPASDAAAGPRAVPLAANRWRDAYELDCLSLDPALHWPDPLLQDAYRMGIWRSLGNFLNGRQQETWVIEGEGQDLRALGSIVSEWGWAHRMSVRVHPAWQGQLERPLLGKLIRRVRYLSRRTVRIEHPDDDDAMHQMLTEANFRQNRTLTHMRLDLA